jgi:hypothetical protein
MPGTLGAEAGTSRNREIVNKACVGVFTHQYLVLDRIRWIIRRSAVARALVSGDSTRGMKNADNADVVWEGEFPAAASLRRYEEIADKHPDFVAARRRMSGATRVTERRYYHLHEPPPR